MSNTAPFCLIFSTESHCGKGWAYFERSCYQLHRTESTYEKALKTCKSYSAFLVQITSARENKFVAGLDDWPISEDLWIGYNDRKAHGHWVWSRTGKGEKYTNWQRRQPDNSGDCAAIWGNKERTTWDDQPCDNENFFVCEKGKMNK